MNDPGHHERIDRGQRAEAAMREFIDPAFDVVIADYMQRLTGIAAEAPWEVGKITKLASAAKIAEAVRGQIRALIADGAVAGEELKRQRHIEGLPTEKRRWL